MLKITICYLPIRFDPSMVVRIEKAILGGRPLLMMNSVDCVDSMSAPLIHHANHGTEEGGSGGRCKGHRVNPYTATFHFVFS